jgi:hypothetical protein
MKAHLMKASLVAIVFALGFPGVAAAGFDEGLASYERYDYAAALAEWQPLAEAGAPAAQFYLGEMYRQGQGVPYDLAVAGRWYREAAEQGHAAAQFQLAKLYESAGVERDGAKAALWLERAAEGGSTAAMRRLGNQYAAGGGVGQDLVQAHKWLALAAGRGGNVVGFLAETDLRRLQERMSPAAIAEAERLARDWQPRPVRPAGG